MRKYTTLLFDADDTLLDFGLAEATAIKNTCEAFGIPFSEEVGRLYSGINDALWKRLEKGEVTRDIIKIARFEQFVDALDACADAKNMADYYVEALSETGALLDGADELCCKLSKVYDMHIVTNGITYVQKKRFAKSGLAPYFKNCFISEECGSKKPDKEFFDYIFSQIGEKDKSKICIIGDSMSSDILGGINAGIDTCYFSPSRKEGPYTPTYQVASFSEIIELFLN